MPDDTRQDIPRPLPTVGRIVHHVGVDGIHRAAIVTTWNSGTLALYVLRVSGNYYAKMHETPEDPTGTRANSWHWPEREE